MFRYACFIALLISIGIATDAAANTTLVQFHWTDPSESLLEPFDLQEDALTSVEPGSRSRGNSEWAHEKNYLRKLYFWVSRDGIDWRRADLHVTSWSSLGLKGHVERPDIGMWDDVLTSFGWNPGGISRGESLTVFDGVGYAGLSESGERWDGLFSASMSSMQVTQQRSVTTVTEPAGIAVFGVGLVGLVLARRPRRRV